VTIAPEVQRALDHDLVIDITTTGGKTGEPRTLEIWFHRIEGRYFITGWPGVRGWYANLQRDPHLTVTFTRSGGVRLPATARLVTADAERRHIIGAVFEVEGGESRGNFESWVASSPVIEFIPTI
jgi:deazaflavin-dependent oxidoreductase (nitroreductase family)